MRKIVNILLTIVFLISFIGVQIHRHYSQGKLYDVAIFHEAESCCNASETCEMERVSDGQCEHQSNHDISCKTTVETFMLHDNFINEKYSSPSVNSIELFVIYFSKTVESNYCSTHITNFISYSIPPNPVENFQTEFSTFLC